MWVRYTVDQALADPWVTDQQCRQDLARLEQEERPFKKNKKIQKLCNAKKNLQEKS
jgi:hypothetical protein